MSYQIELPGGPVAYLPAAEAVQPPVLGNYDELEDRRLRTHPRLRRVLIPLIHGRAPGYYMLHWSNGQDLEVLDSRVAHSQWRRSDFDDAVPCEPRSIVCRSCDAVLRVAAVEASLPLFGDDMSDRLRRHVFIERCPVCADALNLLVVEILD
jgi:hypothetical protein